MSPAATIADWLSTWLATVPPGHCPACKEPLPERKGRGRPAYVHSSREKPECRAEYQRQRNAAVAGPTSLREVVSRVPSGLGHVSLALDCGCVKEVPASVARRIIGRAYCPRHST